MQQSIIKKNPYRAQETNVITIITIDQKRKQTMREIITKQSITRES